MLLLRPLIHPSGFLPFLHQMSEEGDVVAHAASLPHPCPLLDGVAVVLPVTRLCGTVVLGFPLGWLCAED
jgi:hypothetical protein